MTPPRLARLAGVAAGIAVAAVLPWMFSSYVMGVLSYALTVGVVACSAHLLTHAAGQPTLGQGLYFGTGAYAAVVAAQVFSPHAVVGIGAAIAASMLVAAVAGTLVRRLRGMTFLLATLMLGELGRIAAERLIPHAAQTAPPVTFTPLAGPTTSDGHLYWYTLACAVLLIAVTYVLTSSRLGARLSGLAGNERRLASAGFSGDATLWAGYVAAAGIAGAAGAMLAATRRFAAPADLGFEISSVALIAAIIGGKSPVAAAAAAAGLILLRDLAGNEFTGYSPLVLGIAFLAVALLRSGNLPGRKEPT